MHMHQRNLYRLICLERNISRQHLKQTDAKRINIRLRACGLSLGKFRRKVMYRTHDIVCLRQLHRAFGKRNTEIEHLDGAIGFDNDILRLDITMDDAAAVRFCGCAGQLDHDIDRLFGKQCSALLNHLLQRLSGDILHDNIMVSLVFTDIIDFHDVRM